MVFLFAAPHTIFQYPRGITITSLFLFFTLVLIMIIALIFTLFQALYNSLLSIILTATIKEMLTYGHPAQASVFSIKLERKIGLKKLFYCPAIVFDLLPVGLQPLFRHRCGCPQFRGKNRNTEFLNKLLVYSKAFQTGLGRSGKLLILG